MKEITAYCCEHCKKVYQKKHACEKHEKEWCRHNPTLKAKCFYDCKHLTSEYAIIYQDVREGQMEVKVSLLYCTKKEAHIVPFWAVKKGNWYDAPYIDGEEIDSIFAPMECESFENRL